MMKHERFEIPPDTQVDEHQSRHTHLRKVHTEAARRVRNRAIIDTIILFASTVTAFVFGQTPHEKLLLCVATVGIGLFIYIIRRNRDLTALARASRWREVVIEGRGITLDQWIKGTHLPDWQQRRDRQQQKDTPIL